MISSLTTWVQAVPLMRQGYHCTLLSKVRELRRQHTIYPPAGQELRALEVTPFDVVKVVIVGQDPYHGEGQANGLAFAVPDQVPPPPSLRNILKEVAEDIYSDQSPAPPLSPDLSAWAVQGVLLLNASLTVKAAAAGSHSELGWSRLTDAIIARLSERRDHLVFMLWGRFAQAKHLLIDAARHLILEAPHPSPLSAYRGFFGCRHFSKANAYLMQHGQTAIRW